MLDIHKYKVQKFILNNRLHELHPIEALQVRNGSFDLKTIILPCAENGYMRKESLSFHIPTEAERKEASGLHKVSMQRPLQVSDLIH